jgi:hypothetical protein
MLGRMSSFLVTGSLRSDQLNPEDPRSEKPNAFNPSKTQTTQKNRDLWNSYPEQ